MVADYTMPPIVDTPESEEERKRRAASVMPPAVSPGTSTQPRVDDKSSMSMPAYEPGSRDYKLSVGATSQPEHRMPPVVQPAAPDLGAPSYISDAKMPPAGTPQPSAASGPSANTMPAYQPGPQEKMYDTAAQQERPQLHGWRKVLDVLSQIHPLGRIIERNVPGSPGNYDAKLASLAQRAMSEQKIGAGEREAAAAPGEAELKRRNVESEISARGNKDEAALAKIGMRRDQNGAIVPDENSEVFKTQEQKNRLAEETQKNLTTYRQSQIDLNEARTSVEKAKNDPNSPAYKAAQQKLAMAQRAHEIAAQNLGLHQAEFANKIQEQELVKPSGQATSRGSAAQAVLDLYDRPGKPGLESLVKKNADQMGPLMGRLNRGEVRIGDVPPDVAELYAAMKSFYALQPAVHGFRTAEFVKDFETALGTLERDPQAFIAGMKGLRPTLESIANEGKTFHKRIVEGGGNNQPAAGGKTWNAKTGRYE